MKESVAYDTNLKQCLNGFKDSNYIDYNSADSIAKNLTAPPDYYSLYVPQKYGETWVYGEPVCQSNGTMCVQEITSNDVWIMVCAPIFVCICFCCIFYCLLKPKPPKEDDPEPEKEAEAEVEVVVTPGVTIESQTVTNTTTTQMHSAIGPPPGVAMMPPPPMPPGVMMPSQ